MAPDEAEGFFTVHFRHALVHEDDVIFVRKSEFHGFFSAACRIDLNLRLLKEFGGNDKVHLGVIDNEDFCIRSSEAFMVCVFRTHALLELFPEVSDRLINKDALRDGESECRTDAVGAFDLDVSAHHVEEHLGYRKAQSGAFLGAVLIEIDTLKLAKELADVFFADPDSRIGHGYGQIDHGLAVRDPELFNSRDLKSYAALVSIFDGIIEYVSNDLPDPYDVAEEIVGKMFVDVGPEREVLFPGLEIDHVADVIDDRAELVFYFDDVHPAFFDLREIEDVVDDGQQVVARAVNVSGIDLDLPECFLVFLLISFLKLFGLGGLTKDHLVHAEDGVYRSPDLVARVREKISLRFACVFCLFQGLFLSDLGLYGLILGERAHDDVCQVKHRKTREIRGGKLVTGVFERRVHVHAHYDEKDRAEIESV